MCIRDSVHDRQLSARGNRCGYRASDFGIAGHAEKRDRKDVRLTGGDFNRFVLKGVIIC